MRIFVCISSEHVTKENRSKFDVKIVKCIFIVYYMENIGQRLYDPHENKIIVNMDVIFDEKDILT